MLLSKIQFYFFSILCLMLFGPDSRAQYKQGDVWVLGYDSNGHTPEVEGTILDFSSENLQIYPFQTAISLFYTNSSISDADGNLLYYTNGAMLANRDHTIILDTICNSENYSQNSFFGYSQPDGVSLLNIDDSIAIIFLDYNILAKDTFVDFRSYLKINYINNITNSSSLFNESDHFIQDTLEYSGLSINRHTDNKSWWLLVWNRYTFVPISINLIDVNNFHVNFGQQFDVPDEIFKFIDANCFSPDGKKYVRFQPDYICALFDFDRSNGDLSNFKHWIVDEGKNGAGGVSFSPSGRFLYVSNGAKLFQYDTEADDVPSSEVLIAEWDEYRWQGLFSTAFNVHKNTPDCRIFISTAGTTPYLHVIHHPDEKGAACGFEMRGIELPWPHDRGLPNIPNYRLGTPEENYCDSIKVHTNELIRGWLPAISPNPVSDQLRIVWPQSVDMQIIHIVDIQGRIIHRERPTKGSREQLISSESWNSGTYIVELFAADGSRVVRKVVKQ